MCSDDARCCGNSGHLCECATIMSGLLRPCLLLLIAEGESKHGYELSGSLEALGLDVSTDGGRLYRALRHLERDGLVESSWHTQSTGPARRIYTISPAGMEFLRGTASSIDATLEALSKIALRLQQLK